MIRLKINFHFAIIALSILFTSNLAWSQKFGKIDMDNLRLEKHVSYEDADYAYIFKNCHVYYDLKNRAQIVEDYHYRIKVFNDDANNVGDIVHIIYGGKDGEEIKKIKASSFNLVNGKIEETKLEKKDIFKEELSKNATKVSFAIPNIKAGTIIEYKFRVYSPYLYAFPRHYFQGDQPVDYSKLEVDVPEYFTMTPISKGYIPLEQEREETQSYGNSVTKFTFVAKDVPPIADDKYVLNVNDYRSSLKYELKAVSFPGTQPQIFTKDWNSISANLMQSDGFGKVISKKVKPAEAFLNSIASDSDEDKVVKIVDFINKNVAWNENLGIYGTSDFDKLFEKKEGNSGQINLLLINLLNKAGIAASPVLTKYRFGGILYTFSPSLTELDYVFALAQIGDQQFFVDATSPYYEPGKLPLRALNQHGLLVQEKSGQLITIQNTNLNYAKVATKYTIDVENLKLNGSGKTTLKDYATVKARQKSNEENNDEDEQDFIIEEEGDDVVDEDEDESDEDEEDEELEDVYNYTSGEGMGNKYGPIKSAFESELYSPIESIGNQVFIDAFVSLEFDDNPFLDEQREYPAFFNAKHHLNHISVLQIPEGYTLSSRPDDIMMKMINDKGVFKYTITESPNSLTVNCLFKIDSDTFLPEEYASLYEFFNMVIKKQGEKIVLDKI